MSNCTTKCTIKCTVSPDHHYPILLAGILFQQELKAEWLEWNLSNMLVVNIEFIDLENSPRRP